MSTFEIAGLIKATFNGNNGAGYISVPGVKVGDVLLMAAPSGTTPDTAFFNVIADTADSIYQSSGNNLTGTTYTAILARMP